MANITITVQSLLNTAVYDSYTIDNGQTINQLKTAINTAQSFDSTWYDIVQNEHIVSGTATLSSLGITTGTQLRTHNKIARLATKELKQIAKLELAKLDRAASSNPRSTYDITELPNPYNDNDVSPDENANTGGLIEGRPWIEQAYTIPSGMDRNEPYIHSGTYKTAAAASIPAYSLQGTKYTPAYVASVTNQTAGLYRRKYVGNFNDSNDSNDINIIDKYLGDIFNKFNSR